MTQAATAADAASLGQRTGCRHFTTQIVGASLGAVTVKVTGELDLIGADVLEAVLAECVGPVVVRLDASGLSFFDCAGLRAILAAHHRLLRNLGQLVLVEPARCVRRVLSLTQLHSVFAIVTESSPAEAEGSRMCLGRSR